MSTSYVTPRLLGHRGACAELPENTLPSFARALERGVDVLETDVHMTRDGHIVTSHDDTGMRAAGVPSAIRDCDLSEVRRWDAGWGFVAPAGGRPFAAQGIRIPLLEEVLDAFPDVRLNVDIKQRRPSLVEPLLELVRRRDDELRVTLASFHTRVIGRVRARGFRGTTALSRDEVRALCLLPEALCRRLIGGQAVQIPPRAGRIDLSSRAFIDKCHRLGLWVDYWTINDPTEADVLLDRGADGLISDDPGRLAPIVARYR